MSSKKLTTKEAAAYLRLQPCTLEAWRCHGRGPKFQKIGGRRVIYDEIDLSQFAADCTVLTTDTCPGLAKSATASNSGHRGESK